MGMNTYHGYNNPVYNMHKNMGTYWTRQTMVLPKTGATYPATSGPPNDWQNLWVITPFTLKNKPWFCVYFIIDPKTWSGSIHTLIFGNQLEVIFIPHMKS